MIAGAATKDIPVVVLFSWVGISEKTKAHIQFVHILADDISHRHAVE